jgi:hypothetical protein
MAKPVGRPARQRPELCSKCQIYPPSAGQRWCPKCMREYQAGLAETKLTQAEAAGFGRGIEAMREMLVLEFLRLGLVQVTCVEVASAIRQSPRPRLPTDSKERPGSSSDEAMNPPQAVPTLH